MQENYLGEDQVYTDMSQTWTPEMPEQDRSHDFDPRSYRPMEVTVTLMAHEIHAHLMQVCKQHNSRYGYFLFHAGYTKIARCRLPSLFVN